VCRQISGDRGSLFLVRGTGEQRFLVSKLFDVTDSSLIEDTLHTEATHIKVQFGKGIAGTVALTKQPINIKDAYQVFGRSTSSVGLSLSVGPIAAAAHRRLSLYVMCMGSKLVNRKLEAVRCKFRIHK